MTRGIALEAARLDIATRIRHVCGGYPEVDFEELVAQMASIEVKYRLRDDFWFYREVSRMPVRH